MVMSEWSQKLLPCVAFFRAGRVVPGIGVLLLQLSLIFWPVANRMARELNERSGVERLLAELSERHRPPADHYAKPKKRFRQAA
jgi:hypothetical protein